MFTIHIAHSAFFKIVIQVCKELEPRVESVVFKHWFLMDKLLFTNFPVFQEAQNVSRFHCPPFRAISCFTSVQTVQFKALLSHHKYGEEPELA